MRTLLLIAICSALLGPALSGCGRDKEEARRELLRPVDTQAKRLAEREKKRIIAPNGELIPSDQKLAGIAMPKGLELYRSFELEWYLEGKGMSVPQLERYFAARLDPLGIERGDTFVKLTDARLRDDPSARRVTVQLSRMVDIQTVTNVYIRQARPPRTFAQQSESEAKINAMRQRAD